MKAAVWTDYNKIEALKKKTKNPEAEKTLAGELAAIDGKLSIDFADKYITLVYPQKSTLLDHFSDDTLVIICGKNATKAQLDAAEDMIDKIIEI